MMMRKVTDIPMGSYNAAIVLEAGKVEFPINLEYIRYDSKVNPETLAYITSSEMGYDEINWPTINELLKDRAYEKPIVPRYDVYKIKGFDHCTTHIGKPDFKAIQQEFRENGFKVTLKALRHNFKAWSVDRKSGYRDERNKYHLFTPCGCNHLSFRATKLHPNFEDWQETYGADNLW